MEHMHTGYRQKLARSILAALVVSTLAPAAALAQQVQLPSFELRPHCDSVAFRASFEGVSSASSSASSTAIEDAACPKFTVKDPTTVQTDTMKEGDILDIDLVLQNPTAKSLTRFRAWLAYDPAALNGETLEISKLFPTPSPDEQNFSVSDGYIKLSATADSAQSANTIVLAHLRLKVQKGSSAGSPIAFYDASGTLNAHTAIINKTGNQETVIAMSNAGTLLVNMEGSGAAASSAASTQSSSTVSAGSSVSSASAASESSAPSSLLFPMLQVQRVKVTTEGSSVFLAWDVLPSAELIGYNLYYGATSGKYIQKRSIDKSTTNMTIRALPTGVTYYFAVRGVNAKNEETDFSQEVAVSVGDPKTSTAPLTTSGRTQPPKTPATGGKVSGDTGPTSGLLLFLGLSAVIGTGLAFRRQLSARS